MVNGQWLIINVETAVSREPNW